MKQFVLIQLLLSFIYLVSTSTTVVQINHSCSQGPLITCQNIEIAKRCNSLSKCIELWQTQTTSDQLPSTMIIDDNNNNKEYSSLECRLCEAIASDIKILRTEDNASLNDLINSTQQLCTRLISPLSLQQSCLTKFVDKLKYGVEMLDRNVAPLTVCRALQMCTTSAFQPTSLRPFLELAWKSKKSSQFPIFHHTNNNNQCENCMNFFKDIKNRLSSNITYENLIEALNLLLCDDLPDVLNKPCRYFVDNYARQWLDLLNQQFEPKTDCTLMGFCNANKFSTVILTMNSFMKQFQFAGSSNPHMICMEWGNAAKSNDETNFDFVITNTCAKMRKILPQNCEFLLNLHKSIWKLLIKNVDNVTRFCSHLSKYSGGGGGRSGTGDISKRRSIIKNQSIGGTSSVCSLCLMLIDSIEDYLPINETAEVMVEAMDLVCSVLFPQEVRNECHAFVADNGLNIVHLIIEGVAPRAICTLLDFCLIPLKMSPFQPMLIPEKCFMSFSTYNRNNALLINHRDRECCFPTTFLCRYPDRAIRCDVAEMCSYKTFYNQIN